MLTEMFGYSRRTVLIFTTSARGSESGLSSLRDIYFLLIFSTPLIILPYVITMPCRIHTKPKHISLHQLSDAKRTAEEHANTLEEVENARRKLSRDQEDLYAQIEDLKAEITKLEKSKKRLQGM